MPLPTPISCGVSVNGTAGVFAYTYAQMRFYAIAARAEAMQELAAAREQVRVLREALVQGEVLANGDLTGLEWKTECRRFLVAARAALAATQQGANHGHTKTA